MPASMSADRAPAGYVRMPGSERRPARDAELLGLADPEERFSVLIVLRHRVDVSVPAGNETQRGQRRRMPVEEFTAKYGASPEDIAAVTAFAERLGLTVEEIHAARRTVEVSGTVAQMSAAFGVKLGRYRHTILHSRGRRQLPHTEIYRGRDGFIYVPRELADIVIGVFGLDNRTITQRNITGDPSVVGPLTVQQITQLYRFPPGSARGQTIGIISASGGFGGYFESDLELYFGSGAVPTVTPIPVNNITNGSVQANTTVKADAGTKVLTFASTSGVLSDSFVLGPAVAVADPDDLSVSAVTSTTVTLNEPLTSDLPAGSTIFFNPDGETTQDICIAAAAAPGASVGVFFLNGSQSDWVKAIGQAMVPNTGDPFCSVLSSSFYVLNGDDQALPTRPGPTTTTDFVNALSAAFADATNHFAITVCIASGDTGANSKLGHYPTSSSPLTYGGDGKAHVQYPASDPNVLAVGGTTIGKSSATTTSYVEYVWNDPASADPTQGGTTGGGVSAFFTTLPSWQADVGVPKSVNDGTSVGRGVPDVAANASLNSGYGGLFLANQPFTGNGTSAASPLWAGLITLINATLGTPAGFVNPIIYELGSGCFNPLNPLWPDPADPDLAGCPGNNDNNTITGYPAGAGWDACTGWGSPDGTKLLNGLAQHLQTHS